MKSNHVKLLALLVLLVLSASIVSLARGGRHRGEGRPIRREIKAYFQANIMPVLRQQRQKLEAQLAAADRAELATYRTQLNALKEQGHALRKAVMPAAGNAGTAPAGRPALSEAQREQAHQLRFQAQGIMLKVAEMARKYDGQITKLTEEVQPQKEKWATDIKGIVAKNATPEQQQKIAARPGRRQHGAGGLRKFFKPAMFLLLDPNAPAENPAERSSVGSSSFYPNPAAATTQLEYDVKKAGPVSVDLLDKDGNKLRTLVAETPQEKGAHTEALNLSDLPAGTYFYKITTKSGTQTKRFVRE